MGGGLRLGSELRSCADDGASWSDFAEATSVPRAATHRSKRLAAAEFDRRAHSFCEMSVLIYVLHKQRRILIHRTCDRPFICNFRQPYARCSYPEEPVFPHSTSVAQEHGAGQAAALGRQLRCDSFCRQRVPAERAGLPATSSWEALHPGMSV